MGTRSARFSAGASSTRNEDAADLSLPRWKRPEAALVFCSFTWCPPALPLPTGAGDASGSGIPAPAFQLSNDPSLAQFVGAAPPPGHGKHHYYIVVHAVDVPTLGIPKNATPALLGFNLFFHTLARAMIVPWAER